jgi:hypothetical protein
MDKLYGDDLRVGIVYRFGRHEVTHDELVEFAQKWDPQDFPSRTRRRPTTAHTTG